MVLAMDGKHTAGWDREDGGEVTVGILGRRDLEELRTWLGDPPTHRLEYGVSHLGIPVAGLGDIDPFENYKWIHSLATLLDSSQGPWDEPAQEHGDADQE